MEAKKYATKQPMDHWIFKIEAQKISRYKNDCSKPMWHRKSNSKREVSSNTSLPQKTIEKKSNKPNFSLEQLEKEETKPKVNRR